ncbi:MAG: hypothetical protein ACM3NZ_03395 [Betaproteobacteria bacterium]|jgi:hypothetical protein
MVGAAVGLGAGALLLLAYLAFAPLRLRDEPSGVRIREFGRA